MVDFSQIFKATYSGVPVYEMNCKGVAVMRRRSDSYLNATQILKVADFDKPQRTRILEREVQTGEHEKVQGGYGKYQGTWVPFERGKALAELYEVDDILAPILQFVKGDESPPLAPKHVTAATARPRKARDTSASSTTTTTTSTRIRKRVKHFDEDVSNIEMQNNNNLNHHTPTTPRLAETTAFAKYEDHMPAASSPLAANSTPTSTKRTKLKKESRAHHLKTDTGHADKRMPSSIKQEDGDKESRMAEDEIEEDDPEMKNKPYAQRLLQYFMSNKTKVPALLSRPPADLDLNVIIDDEGHTSLHWAAAMARIKVVKILIENGADAYRVNYKGQTALMRSVLFTNNFDLKTFDALLDLLRTTIFNIDKRDQTVFHHTASMSDWKGKVYASRYYMECLINKLKSNQSELISILNVQDTNGDTALTIAAKIGNRRLIKLMMDAGASTEIANEQGMTPRDYFSEAEKNATRASPPLISTTASSSPSEGGMNETDTRNLLRAKVDAMFKNVTNDPNNAQPISEVFDEFAESYERDLVNKEKMIEKKKIEVELHRKRLEETKRVLESVALDKQGEELNAMLKRMEEDGKALERRLRKWLQYSQRQTMLALEEEYHVQQNNEKPPSPPQLCSVQELQQKAVKLSNELKALQASRKKHINTLIEMRCRLPPKKYQDYKRLISTSCNVAYENVDMMLGPLLASFDSDSEAARDSISSPRQ
ncbi:MAG: hypothetical protein EXX96DRAFT_595339 [Benjaminiella poitrasii]|nr:MAG: hypothetical protein EXX96DRAFT_595339 [Benjaminiella poitrasii]